MAIKRLVVGLLVVWMCIGSTEGLIRRCFTCRSRGDLGTCKDPFKMNGTSTDDARKVPATPCASGWCGKILEGGSSFKDDDYGIATQRLCLQRSPSDNEERCAYTMYNHKKVYMCFCLGDLCNDGKSNLANLKLITVNLVLIFSIVRFVL